MCDTMNSSLGKKRILFTLFRYDYAAYDYGYDANSALAYQSYAGYEAGAAYAQPGAYDGYAQSAAYPAGNRLTPIK